MTSARVEEVKFKENSDLSFAKTLQKVVLKVACEVLLVALQIKKRRIYMFKKHPILIILIILSFILGLTCVASAATAVAKKASVSVAKAALKKAPSSRAKSLIVLKKGTQLVILDNTNKDWLKVKAANKVGYISRKSAILVKPAVKKPVATVKPESKKPLRGTSAGNLPKKDQEHLPKVLSIGTHGIGSSFNTIGAGIASTLSNKMPTEVKAIAMSGPQEWLPMMKTNEIDLGVINNWDAGAGWKGTSTYGPISDNKGFPFSIITSGHKNLISMLVIDNSDIKKGSDLKGKRYGGIITGAPGITAQLDAFLANSGLQRSDVTIVTLPSVNAGVDALNEGRVDAVTGAVGMGKVAELDATKGARWLPWDTSPEATKKAMNYYPVKYVKLSPSKANVGIRGETEIISYDIYLVGRNNLAESTAYSIVKDLWENNKQLAAININLSDWTPENFVVDNFTVPYHPGAIKFYKEKGVWTPDMEKRQKMLLTSK